MNEVCVAQVGPVMQLFLMLLLAAGAPASALAQEAPEGDDVRSADEIPEDMPDPPEDAPPAEAPPVDGTDERPPHPETPEDLEELQPTAETLAKTSYHWLPGHWMWTGEQFEWKSGEWVYKVKDMILVAADPLSDLASALPLPLVSPARALPPGARISPPSLSPRTNAPQSAL